MSDDPKMGAQGLPGLLAKFYNSGVQHPPLGFIASSRGLQRKNQFIKEKLSKYKMLLKGCYRGG